MQGRPNDLPLPAAVLLDLDGTLVDTVETRIQAWLAAFDEVAIPVTHEQLEPLIGIDGRRLVREVAAAGGVDLEVGRDEAVDRLAGEIYGRLNRDPRPVAGARELLTSLEAHGIRWAIATSSRREQVAASVAALELTQPPTIVDGTHVEHAKPAPDLLLVAARELGADPAVTWCVGDSTWDMRAAVAAGMVPVGVTTGAVGAEVLRSAGARATLASLAELIPILG
jgi:HAD superfamily hydrolase (TIGR01509 family)